MAIGDRYEVQATLGEGGFSRVYRGEEKGTGRKVALKVLKSAYYKNPEVDKLLLKGQTTVDEDARQDAYYKAQEIMHEDAPWVPIAYVTPPLAMQETVTGLDPNPTSSEPFNTVKIEGGQ